MSSPKLVACECADHACPVHPGSDCPRAEEDTAVLFRVDMDDYTGTAFCSDCYNDAMRSGLFVPEDTE